MARFNYRPSSRQKTVKPYYAICSILAFLIRAVARAHYNGANTPTHTAQSESIVQIDCEFKNKMPLFDIRV